MLLATGPGHLRVRPEEEQRLQAKRSTIILESVKFLEFVTFILNF